MGMHHGVVAADASAERLIAVMNAHLPTVAAGEKRGTLDDGDGLRAALASLGFDYDAWAGRGDLRELIYEPGAEAPAEPGALSEELEAFRASVEIPAGKQPKPKVIRRETGFDIAAAPPSEKKKGGLFGFLRRG